MHGRGRRAAVEPERGDRRFKDQAWSEELVFDYIKQSYLLSARWLRALVEDVPGSSRAIRRRSTSTRASSSARSRRRNFVLTNPAVLRKARETGGQNLLDGPASTCSTTWSAARAACRSA